MFKPNTIITSLDKIELTCGKCGRQHKLLGFGNILHFTCSCGRAYGNLNPAMKMLHQTQSVWETAEGYDYE